jgi:hypothetical protein
MEVVATSGVGLVLMLVPARVVLVIARAIVVARPNFDFHSLHACRHRDDERTDVAPDVQQDCALTGVRILPWGRGHDALVVPGWVW